MRDEPVIRLHEVTKRFGQQTALDDMSLEVHPGQVFALLGENGAGKTTAIKIMLGLEHPDAGTSEVLGFDSQGDGLRIRQQVGYVAESPTLYDWMTVDEIGWFAAGFYPDGYQQRFQQQADEFGLPRKKQLKSLSKGMRSKVVLSLALAHDPSLLVLDEPTSGLDALVRREFLESMVELAASGRTVFLSSHQIAEVERVADIVAMVRDGKVLLVESLDALKVDTREVIVTFDDPQQADQLNVPWSVLGARTKGRQRSYLVRDWDESRLNDLQQAAGVNSVDSRAPPLEEIFVAYMQSDRLNPPQGQLDTVTTT